jgi:hypothetical protein
MACYLIKHRMSSLRGTLLSTGSALVLPFRSGRNLMSTANIRYRDSQKALKLKVKLLLEM